MVLREEASLLILKNRIDQIHFRLVNPVLGFKHLLIALMFP